MGLYLNPPERALVLGVDEKAQIQALDAKAGPVIGEFHQRHRAVEFRSFLATIAACSDGFACSPVSWRAGEAGKSKVSGPARHKMMARSTVF